MPDAKEAWCTAVGGKTLSTFAGCATVAPRFTKDVLHVPAVLAADLEQGAGDLAQRANTHRIHQYFEDIAVVDHRLLQAVQHRRRVRGISDLELTQPFELALFFLFG